MSSLIPDEDKNSGGSLVLDFRKKVMTSSENECWQGVICGLSLLLVLALAPRVFLRVLRFSSLLKKSTRLNSNSVSRQWMMSHFVKTPLQIIIIIIIIIKKKRFFKTFSYKKLRKNDS